MNARYFFALALPVFLVSCSNSAPDPGTRTSPPQRAITSATRDMFKTRCAPCHGEAGHADGPAVVKLPTKPPNFADVGWQKSVTDDEIRNVVVHGGVAVGKGSAMPAVPELEGKPELDEILALVRGFGSE